MNKYLHIVCAAAPWPADNSTAIDMLYCMEAFYKEGVKIFLHYFTNGAQGIPNELNRYCEKIQVYTKLQPSARLLLKQPHTVVTPTSEALIANLLQDNHPVLLHGLCSTGIIHHINKDERKIIIRVLNDEAVDLRTCTQPSFNFMKKMYYRYKSYWIKKQETKLPANCLYACVSEGDVVHLQQLGLSNSLFVPVFTGWQQVSCPDGMGNFCLYQGNLSIPENEKAALWLLSKVFTTVRVPFLIAGKNPSRRLQKAAALCQHTCLVSNPTETDIEDLIRKAHIHVLPCFNTRITGIRLKLLHALFKGRHCVATPAAVSGTPLADACHIGTSAAGMAAIIAQLYYQPFAQEEIALRKHLLCNTYNNAKNIQQFIQYLW